MSIEVNCEADQEVIETLVDRFRALMVENKVRLIDGTFALEHMLAESIISTADVSASANPTVAYYQIINTLFSEAMETTGFVVQELLKDRAAKTADKRKLN